MSPAEQPRDKGVARFRTRLFTAMMVIVATLTGLGFYLAQRKVTADAQRNLQAIFQTELSSLHKLEELRHAALADRCNALAAKSRIHAAIEDNAIDLLYPSAKDELRDLMEGEEPPPEQAAQSLHARFYRFLDSKGAVIKPLNSYDVGELDAKTEAQLALDKLPDTQQIGYIQENTQADGGSIDEVIAVPIFSTDTGDVISALVIGFKPLKLEDKHTGMKSGIWTNGQLHLPALPISVQASLNDKVAGALANSDQDQNYFRVDVGGATQLFTRRVASTSLANRRCGRAAFVRRFRRKPSGRVEPFRASEKAGAGFGRESRTTKTRRSRPGFDCSGTGKIHKIFRRRLTSAEKPGHCFSHRPRIVDGARRFQAGDLRGIVRAAPSNASFDRRHRRFASVVTHGRWSSSNRLDAGKP